VFAVVVPSRGNPRCVPLPSLSLCLSFYQSAWRLLVVPRHPALAARCDCTNRFLGSTCSSIAT
jgi:hypothetical protein